MRSFVEDQHQQALFQWAATFRISGDDVLPHSRLSDYLYAIPNGGRRNAREAKRMKAQGVKAGVADLHLPLARHGLHGLWIELKRPVADFGSRAKAKGCVSDSQREWLEKMGRAGHAYCVCFGWEDAKMLLAAYMADGGAFSERWAILLGKWREIEGSAPAAQRPSA